MSTAADWTRVLDTGIAVVEELLDRGVRADAHNPQVRRAMASTLAKQVELRRRFVVLDGLRPSLLALAGP